MVEIASKFLSLESELVPAVQALLAQGLPPSFVKSCVRIGEFQPFGGGLKADLVGGLRIDVNAVLKLGNGELVRHEAMMNEVNRRQPRTFAEIISVVQLADNRFLLLMEQLRKHETFLDRVYLHDTRQADLAHILKKGLDSLSAIHRIGSSDPGAPALAVTHPVFSARLRPRLADLIRNDPRLHTLWDHAGEVIGMRCPPVKELLDQLTDWEQRTAESIEPRLVHGDPHLRNLMARRYGKGFSARWIDPNPEIGYTDIAYDYGKLLHFAEPVGWAVVDAKYCQARLELSKTERSWRLDANVPGAPKAAETRRAFVEKLLWEHLHSDQSDPTSIEPRRIHAARASAHAGLLPRMQAGNETAARDFVLAHTLHALAQWYNDSVVAERKRT